MRFSSCATLLIGLVRPWLACAQLSLPTQQPIVGAQMPALSPEGKRLAFVYRGDIWIASDKGGHATPLTQHLELDAFPLFSPDGKWLAFASKRNGNWDIFAVPADGGTPMAFGLRSDIWTVSIDRPKGVAGRSSEFARRLTDWVGDDSDFSWSPDGKKLYFSSDREFTTRIYELELQPGFWVSGKEGGLYVLALESGEARRLVKAPGAQWHGLGGGDFAWSPDMHWMAYANRGESGAWNIWVLPAEGPEDWLEGRDPQLDKAIDLLLAQSAPDKK